MIDVGGLHAYRARLDRDRSRYFVDWMAEAGVRDACWVTLADTTDALIVLGPEPAEGAVAEVLRRGVSALDGLTFTKPEREDLLKNFYEIGALAGMDAVEEWAEGWRSW